MRLLDKSFKISVNTVRINTHNSLAHEIGKLKKAYNLILEGKTIVTEAIFKNGARADILVLDDFRVFEIMVFESEKEALSKTQTYPPELDIVFLKASEV